VVLLVFEEPEEGVKNTEGEAEGLEALHTKDKETEVGESSRIKVNNSKTQHLLLTQPFKNRPTSQ
jgi:hypothetical protein